MSLTKNVADVLHRIRAQLYPNYLRNVDGKYLIRTKNEPVQGVEQICASLVNRGGATVSYDDLVHHINEYEDEKMFLLANGFPVRNKYYTLRPNVAGTADSPDGPLDPDRNGVYFTFHPTAALRALCRRISVFLDGLANVDGYVGHVTDVRTGSVDGGLSPGGQLIVEGHKISVKGEKPEVGFFFVNRAGERVKVTERFTENSANKVIITIPAGLAAGVWRIEIVTQFTLGGILLKEPRTITFDQDLTVQTVGSRRPAYKRRGVPPTD
jgi:hypothetical protein